MNLGNVPVPAPWNKRPEKYTFTQTGPRDRLRVTVEHTGAIWARCVDCSTPISVGTGTPVELFNSVGLRHPGVGPLCQECSADRPSPPVPVMSVTLNLGE